MFKKTDERDVLRVLPRTVEDLDGFVERICNLFDLPHTDDTYDNIATMIMHMPPSACRAPYRYFGESAIKSIANKAAYEKLAEFREKRKQAEMKAKEEAALKLVPDQKSVETTQGSTDVQPVQNATV